ncbi:MAG: TIGR03032 family protein [Cyanobacteria bacterium P01_F01_bin.143]
MKLTASFYQLPFRFDVEKLTQEIAQFSESDWIDHPQNYSGNDALLLIAVNGDTGKDSFQGAMRPTPHLQRCPYLQQVLASFNTTLGNTRLMRLRGEASVKPHADANYYWLQRVRIHIPIVTLPEVKFHCGKDIVHMGAGEAWIFNTWQRHQVINPTSHERIHLVIDTVGSREFWDLLEQSRRWRNGEQESQLISEPRYIPYQPEKKVNLKTEKINIPLVISPWEFKYLCDFFLTDLREVAENNPQEVADLATKLHLTYLQWQDIWVAYGNKKQSYPLYHQALQELVHLLSPFKGKLRLSNRTDFFNLFNLGVLNAMLSVDQSNPNNSSPNQTKNLEEKAQKTQKRSLHLQLISQSLPEFERPIFIVAAPRSGSTLLFETLAQSPSLWTIGGESHQVFESISKLHPAQRLYESNVLDAMDIDSDTITALKFNFTKLLKNRDGQTLPNTITKLRMLEKTPKNALRIPFLKTVFPDAKFIYLYREPQGNISSIIEAWQSQKFVTYPQLPNWEGNPWSMLLIPGWRNLRGKSLGEIAAAQWYRANQEILKRLATLEKDRWCTVKYSDLISNPQQEIKRLSDFADIEWDCNLQSEKLPLSRYTLTPPDPDKWRKHEAEITKLLPNLQPLIKKVEELELKSEKISVTNEDREETATPKHSESSSTTQPKSKPSEYEDILQMSIPRQFSGWLQEQNLSIGFTTYQAGKLFLIGIKPNGKISSVERTFGRCLGMWTDGQTIYMTSLYQLWRFQNVLAPGEKHQEKYDALYVPQMSYVTGDLDIHDVVMAQPIQGKTTEKQIVFVNTLYSCLATVSDQHSFIPLWKPPFISKLAAEDRCHLNGLALRDDKPRYVSAISRGDVAGSWQEKKHDGGCIIDVEANEFITTGLSMPHSPRWYRDKLWVSNSGKGEFGYIDLDTGKFEPIVFCPGYLRSCAFTGDYAILGLSKPRDKTFAGLPLGEILKAKDINPRCGLLVIDLRTGDIVFQLLFHGKVQELYEVTVLPGIRHPMVLGFQNGEVTRQISMGTPLYS